MDYNEINKYIPPDVSFGQPVDTIKAAIDATFVILPEKNELAVKEYVVFILNRGEGEEFQKWEA